MNKQVFNIGSTYDALSIAAILVSIAALIWTIYWEHIKHKRAHLDEFWFRSVIGPTCVDPLVIFNNKWVDKFSSVNALPSAKDITTEFCKDKERLLSSLYISKLMFSELYDDACSDLDAVEDKIIIEMGRNYLNENAYVDFSDVKDEIQNSTLKILTSFANKHGQQLSINHN